MSATPHPELLSDEKPSLKRSLLPLNQILEGDCIEVMKTFPEESVDLVVFDPPYNIGKADWDNIADYYEWMLTCFNQFNRVLKSNGCLWLFHISFPMVGRLNGLIEEKTNFSFKQFITINKGLQSIAGRNAGDLRSFPRATEYIVFYTFEDRTGAERLSDTYSHLSPMAQYLKVEIGRAAVSSRELAALFPSDTGGLTGCISNWVLGLNFPLRWQYERLRQYLNSKVKNCEFLRKDYEDLRKDYEDLRKDYEDLRKDYEAQRYPFHLEKGITDVWNISFYEDIFNHPTVKPLRLLDRIIRATSNLHALVLDPCCGSGTTCVAAKRFERNFIGIEINHEYCELARKRLATIPAKLDSFVEAM